MTHFICATCGVQYRDSEHPPEHCPICEDDRQYVGHNGQQWTTLETIQASHTGGIKEVEPNLFGIGAEPRFAIGQRSLLIKREEGNILWDCTTYISDDLIEQVQALGGIDKIAISHPHYYSSMIEWSKAFDAPIYIHEEDKQWVVRPDPAVEYWSGDTLEIGEGVTLIHAAVHFDGAQVLHWAEGAERKGVLLTGDIINVVADRRYVSFMYSFPNQIPVSPTAVRRVMKSIESFDYDRIYSAWFGTILPDNAKAQVQFSAQRYIDAITG